MDIAEKIASWCNLQFNVVQVADPGNMPYVVCIKK